jgi:hypothetical protein
MLTQTIFEFSSTISGIHQEIKGKLSKRKCYLIIDE